jgi:phytoene/squalene synthetase
MQNASHSSHELAAAITRVASKQTYYTLRYLADRQRVADAYRAYAYFRWIDDQIDDVAAAPAEGVAFIERQKALMEICYQGRQPSHLGPEEQMLADLILGDQEMNSGLQSYIRNMMAVIAFDAHRRGRLISELELARYTRSLAIAVTEVLHYFIDHKQPPPRHGARYLAASGAHIAHMLRDTLEDVEAGYFNVPREYLVANKIGPRDVDSEPYRVWIQGRASLARAQFSSGKAYLAQLKNFRLRLAGYVYIARFEFTLDTIERLNYRLLPESAHAEGRHLGVRTSGPALALALFPPRHD